ncbi:hypothetical protein LMH87_007068 [Akanthomyces muscarius]|uniref:Uncharacterized protein n=1 Tax=Akanthomyces muscarius TaxID=2231603 RepID=A0A9W8QQ35_AKAMU|nr:hypothetical protein LMH87_007068 [Akanthomyces muscarius]KAJ4165435.1 hypothetical protein LMH87_007068 [Akanthomyces muscarius]
MGDTVAATPAISIVILALKSEEPVSQIAVGFAFVALVNFGNQVHALALCFSLADTALRGAGQIRAYIQSTPQERDPEDTGQLGESDTLRSTMYDSLLSLVKLSASQDAREVGKHQFF